MMLARGSDILYRSALAAGHQPYVNVQVWRSGVQIIDDLSIAEGAVDATLTNRVSRTLSVTGHEDLYDEIDPYGDIIRAYRGIEFANGELYKWQVFGGPVKDTTLNDEGTCTITAADVAYYVVSNGFATPHNSSVGALVTDEMIRLINDRYDNAIFGTNDTFTQHVPILSWEFDPGQALDEMGTSIGAFWYPQADERFVIRRYPWTVDQAPVVTLADGDGGIVLGSSAKKDRTTIRNRVIVTGERVDGTPPVYGVQDDQNPTSPTYVNGSFGIQAKLIKLNTPANAQTAVGAAFDYLKRMMARTEVWSVQIVPDASLELGDVVELDVRGRQVNRQVIASMTIPLVVQGTMKVSMRAQSVGALEAT